MKPITTSGKGKQKKRKMVESESEGETNFEEIALEESDGRYDSDKCVRCGDEYNKTTKKR